MVSFGVGHYRLGLRETATMLLHPQDLPEEKQFVLVQLRLPRIVAAVLVGAVMAGAGVAMQAVFRNPLVSPFVLGISNGATLGAALGIVFWNGVPWVTEALAFAGGLVAVGLAYGLSGSGRSTVTLLLFGMIVSSTAHALIGLLQVFADTDNRLPALTFWMLGGLDGITLDALWTIVPLAILCLLFLLAWSHRLNLLALGDKEARLLGVDVGRAKPVVLAVATLMVATCVAKTGVIAWIGLVIPHLGRSMIGADNRSLLPLSLVLGGLFLLGADDLARVLIRGELPVGVITAIIGCPVFGLMLWRQRNVGWQ